MPVELPTIHCPAGEPARAGTACYCRIERGVVAQPRDPRVVPAVRRYCTGEHTDCPSWRKARDAWLEDSHRRMDRELEAEAKAA